MIKANRFKKIAQATLALAMMAIVFSSCHREGCPNKITQATPYNFEETAQR